MLQGKLIKSNGMSDENWDQLDQKVAATTSLFVQQCIVHCLNRKDSERVMG